MCLSNYPRQLRAQSWYSVYSCVSLSNKQQQQKPHLATLFLLNSPSPSPRLSSFSQTKCLPLWLVLVKLDLCQNRVTQKQEDSLRRCSLQNLPGSHGSWDYTHLLVQLSTDWLGPFSSVWPDFSVFSVFNFEGKPTLFQLSSLILWESKRGQRAFLCALSYAHLHKPIWRGISSVVLAIESQSGCLTVCVWRGCCWQVGSCPAHKAK